MVGDSFRGSESCLKANGLEGIYGSDAGGGLRGVSEA